MRYDFDVLFFNFQCLTNEFSMSPCMGYQNQTKNSFVPLSKVVSHMSFLLLLRTRRHQRLVSKRTQIGGRFDRLEYDASNPCAFVDSINSILDYL